MVINEEYLVEDKNITAFSILEVTNLREVMDVQDVSEADLNTRRPK